MPPPRPSAKPLSSSVRAKSKFGPSSSKNSSKQRAKISTSSNTSNSMSGSSFKARGSSNSRNAHSSNLSSNSDAHKPRRKRRPKKKKTQVHVTNDYKMYISFWKEYPSCIIRTSTSSHWQILLELPHLLILFCFHLQAWKERAWCEGKKGFLSNALNYIYTQCKKARMAKLNPTFGPPKKSYVTL